MTRRSWTLMALLAATWGASYLFIKVGLRDFSAPFIVCARTALAAVVLLPVALQRRALAGLRGRGRDVVLLAALQVVTPFMLITFGEQHIASALTAILVASAPIFTAVLAFTPYAPAERPGRLALAGLAVGMLGIVLLFGVDLGGDGSAVLGGLLVLLAGLAYSAGAIELRRRMAGVDPAATAAASMAVSALFTLPVALATLPHRAGADSVSALAALGVLGTGLAFLIFYTLIAEIGPARASLVAYLSPGFAVGYGVAVLDESITAGTVAGLALILAGSYAAAGGRFSRSAPSRSSEPAPARAR